MMSRFTGRLQAKRNASSTHETAVWNSNRKVFMHSATADVSPVSVAFGFGVRG
jgi:hypothetical protein